MKIDRKTVAGLCMATLLCSCSEGAGGAEMPDDDKPSTEEPTKPDDSGQNTLFADEFNNTDGKPEESIWKLCTYANNAWAQHFQYVEGYENVKVENGFLKLKVKKDGTTYKNGGIRTKNGFPNNTRLEVRARLTRQVRGGFPAIWQMPVNGMAWPMSGEIDLMEWIQGTPNKVYQTIHYSPSGSGDKSKTGTPSIAVTDWHTYAVDRTDKAVTFYVDGKETWKFKNVGSDNWKEYPFNRYEYDIILNFSLGGMLNGKNTWPGAIVDDDLPGEMWVDWVRVHRL